MDLQLADQIDGKVKAIQDKLETIERNGELADKNFIPEESGEWMSAFKELARLQGEFFLVTNEGSEIQFNEAGTQFRVVTEENRNTKFW